MGRGEFPAIRLAKLQHIRLPGLTPLEGYFRSCWGFTGVHPSSRLAMCEGNLPISPSDPPVPRPRASAAGRRHPLVAQKGMDWMYANCSTTAQRGALDWAPFTHGPELVQFKAVINILRFFSPTGEGRVLCLVFKRKNHDKDCFS